MQSKQLSEWIWLVLPGYSPSIARRKRIFCYRLFVKIFLLNLYLWFNFVVLNILKFHNCLYLHADLLEILGEFNFTIRRENVLVMDLLIHPFEQKFDVGPCWQGSWFLKFQPRKNKVIYNEEWLVLGIIQKLRWQEEGR